jgi:hypothetical protein
MATPLIMAHPAGAVACDTSWDGSSGLWNDSSHWNNGVPTSSTVACIDNGSVNVTGTQAAKGVDVGSGANLFILGTAGDGDASLAVGSVGMTNSGTVQLTNSDTDPHAATLTVDTSASLYNGGTIQTIKSGARTITANVDNHDFIEIDTSTSAGTGASLSNSASANVVIATTGATYDPGTLNDLTTSGDLTSGNFDLAGALNAHGVIKILNGASVTLHHDGKFDDGSGGDALNSLTDIFSGSTVSIKDGGELDPASQLNVTGQIFMQTGVSTIATDTVEVGVSGSIEGGGTINADVINNGTITVDDMALLTVNGSYTQSSTGVLVPTLNNNSSGTGYLNVNGSASIDGTVSPIMVSFVNNNTFHAVVSTSRTGSFATINGTPGTGFKYVEQDQSTGVDLNIQQTVFVYNQDDSFATQMGT